MVNGQLYDDDYTVLNSETGAQVGTIGSSGYGYASITTVDPVLGMAFQLNTSAQYSQLPNRIQPFSLATLTAGASSIPVNLQLATNGLGPIASPYRLTRWGSNGLAFRNSVSVYALRSNVVKDLSSQQADLSVSLAATGASSTGAQTTYVATVVNAGPAAATEVALTALVPATGVLVSATPTSGFCTTGSSTGCNLGTLAANGQATVTMVVNQLSPGTASTFVQVSASETDPNPANNQATLTAAITGATYSPAPTLASISPATIQSGSTDTPHPRQWNGLRPRLDDPDGWLGPAHQRGVCDAADGDRSGCKPGHARLACHRRREPGAGRRYFRHAAAVGLYGHQSRREPHHLRAVYPAPSSRHSVPRCRSATPSKR